MRRIPDSVRHLPQQGPFWCDWCSAFEVTDHFRWVVKKDGLATRNVCSARHLAVDKVRRDSSPPKPRKRTARERAAERGYKLKSSYGLTEAEYDTILAAQGGGCSLCGEPPSHRRLCVDHNHDTGRVRGLLCDNCNQALGKLKDNVEVLHNAIGYLLADQHQ